MAERAHVTSVEVLDDFRSSLIVYLSKARPALEEVGSDVLRIRLWLDNDQRTYWEQQIRRRMKVLEAAQQALFSARLSNLRETTDAETMAVQRAKRAVEEAEAKLRKVKQWSREFESQIEPLAKQLDHLRNLLAIDMPHGAAYLAGAIKSLAEYAGITAGPEPTGVSQQTSSSGAGEASAEPPAPSPPADGAASFPGGTA